MLRFAQFLDFGGSGDAGVNKLSNILASGKTGRLSWPVLGGSGDSGGYILPGELFTQPQGQSAPLATP